MSIKGIFATTGGILALLMTLTSPVMGGGALWGFTLEPGYSPNLTLSTTGSATVKYKVSNASKRLHRLSMRPIPGITSSGCTSALGHLETCILTLSISGTLKGDIHGGPSLCDSGNALQCYQPSLESSLSIKVSKQTPDEQWTVTPSSGANGLISPDIAYKK